MNTVQGCLSANVERQLFFIIGKQSGATGKLFNSRLEQFSFSWYIINRKVNKSRTKGGEYRYIQHVTVFK